MNKRKKTAMVVFHHALADKCSIEEIHSWHLSRGFEGCGYHFLVRKDGSIHHGRDIHYVGAHAMGRNWCSIGVCLEGDFRHSEPTVEQLNGCAQVYHDLCRAYSKRLVIAFHRPWWVRNACPGKMLDREDFREVVGRAYQE